jgi:hypothetical protein
MINSLYFHRCLSIVLFVTFLTQSSAESKYSDHPFLVLRQKALSNPHCGSKWQDDYRLLHARIRNYDIQPYFFIVAHDGQGANDRLTSLITGFFAALLSKRAFFLMTYNGKLTSYPIHLVLYLVAWLMDANPVDAPDFQYVFDSPIIDVNLNSTWYKVFANDRSVAFNHAHTTKIYHRDGDPLFHEKNDNFSTGMIFSDFPIIWFNSNRGYSYRLIRDNHYGQELRKYGIDAYYGFSCAFHYVFQPKEKMLALSQNITDPFKDQSIIKIGIQIRTGDEKMHENDQLTISSSHYYENFFNCALLLEETRIKEEHPGKTVKWFIISDSLSLKKDAKVRYGDKIIANTNDRPVHSGGGGLEKGGKAMMLLFSEQLTLALCDYFIISHNSHVGRIAVWLSEYGASKNNSYIEHRDHEINKDNERTCLHVGNDANLASQGAGI